MSTTTAAWSGGHRLSKQQQIAKKSNNAKQARNFINHVVPKLLHSNRRARTGVEASHLVVVPPPLEHPATEAETLGQPPLHISVQVADTLTAARALHDGKKGGGKLAILNMASPLRPGGGVLSGATSQEECLCSSSTLYAALPEEFYRLPEVGGIYTPDVLVVRDQDTAPSQALLPARERFYVDVVTAGMLRFPSVRHAGGSSSEEDQQQPRQEYEEDSDRALVLEKMRAVMRMMQANGVDRAVLGAWGCGAYGNPVGEVAAAWKKVLLGGGRHRRKRGRDVWPKMEIVFAIKSRAMARQFAEAWGDGMEVEEPGYAGCVEADDGSLPDEDEDEDDDEDRIRE